MASGFSAAPPGPADAEEWVLDCARADVAPAVRDYFSRLGLPARLAGPTEVEVQSSVDEAELLELVRSWTRLNGPLLEVRRRATDTAPAGGLLPLLPPPRLGELLARKGLISDAQLTAGLSESRLSGEMLGVVLLRQGAIYEEELARTLSAQLAVPYISVARVGVDSGAVKLLPPEVGLAAAALPVRFAGEAVQVVFADPTDPTALDAVRRYLPRIEIAIAELSDIRLAWADVARRSQGARAHLVS